MQPNVDHLLQYVADGPTTPTTSQAETALDIAEAIVNAYTRGTGKRPDGTYRDGVGEIVISVATRLLANPSGVGWRNQAGNFSTGRSAGEAGLTVAEQIVLQRYRKTSV